MPNSKTFQSYANYRKASRYLYKADVAVQLEYFEDIPFWQSLIRYSRPNRHIKFYYADIVDGNKQSGKNVCKRYIPYADASLIVCVDSDFDGFLHPGLYSVTNYVLQTYTYSWENHYCYKSSLQRLWAQCGIGNFNFETFIDGLNQILYPILINILAAKNNHISGWSLLKFCGKVLHPSVCKAGALNNNGAGLLISIQQEVSNWANNQPLIPKNLISQMTASATPSGLIVDTAYLYARGHCIYNLICNIGNKLSGNTIAFKEQVLDYSLQLFGYNEIDNVVRDIKCLIK